MKVAAQQAFFSTRMKAILIVVAMLLIASVVSVYVWGKSPVSCEHAFPMGFGCTLGKFEALTSGVIAAIAALFAAAGAISGVRHQIKTQRDAQEEQAKEHADNLACTLHAELADLVARCCFDSEGPWHRYWTENGSAPSDKYNKTELRSFTPAQPTIFTNTSSDLALLGADAPLRLVQFHNSLSALRRDIEYIADGMTEHPATPPQARQVAERFYHALQPGLRALLALAPKVPKAEEVEQAAIDLYDANRLDGPPPSGSLRDRINRLLQMKSSER